MTRHADTGIANMGEQGTGTHLRLNHHKLTLDGDIAVAVVGSQNAIHVRQPVCAEGGQGYVGSVGHASKAGQVLCTPPPHQSSSSQLSKLAVKEQRACAPRPVDRRLSTHTHTLDVPTMWTCRS